MGSAGLGAATIMAIAALFPNDVSDERKYLSIYKSTVNEPSLRAEPVPSEAHCLITEVDAALEQQVLDVAQRQRKADVHHTTRRMTSGDELKQRHNLYGFALDFRFMRDRYQR